MATNSNIKTRISSGAWKIHTPNMLKETMENGGPGISMLRIPFAIFGKILFQVGERAKELDDPKLNALMLQLTIYTIADPESPDYNGAAVNEYIEKHL